jgi:hypothetical protein
MPNCQPEDLCLVIRSAYGNEGREVTVRRWVREGDPLPEWGPLWGSAIDGWVVEARHPLASGVRLGVFRDSQLMPLRPPRRPGEALDGASADQVAHG